MGTVIHLNTAPTVLHTHTIPGTPIDVATDATGTVLVVTQEDEIYSLSGIGAVLNTASLSGSAAPVALTMNDVGDVYVAKSDGTLLHLNTGLMQLHTHTIAGTPVDILASPTGFVYVATSGGRIYRLNSILANPIDAQVSGTPTAIFANGTGDIFVTTSGGAVHRLNTTLTVLSTGTVSGLPVDVVADSAGHTIVATSDGKLHRISDTISVQASRTLSGTLVGVDIDDAGHVVAVNSAGEVFVCNTALSNHTSTSTGLLASAIAINLVGDIYVVGDTPSPAPSITVSKTALPFPDTDVATAPANLPTNSFTVSHAGGGALSVNLTPTGAVAAFEFITPTQFPLNPGDTHTVQVRFLAPAPADDYQMQIVIAASDGMATDSETVDVSGTSTGPTLISVSETALPFPDTDVATAPANLPTNSFTVSHAGGGALSVNLTPTGAVAAFEFITPTQFPLNPGDTHTVQVRFLAPAPADDYQMQIAVVASGSSLTQSVMVFASGTSYVPTPQACYLPGGPLSLNQINAGQSGNTHFTVENCGTGTLEIQSVVLTPTSPPGAPPATWTVTPGVPPITPLENTDPPQSFTITLAIPSGLAADTTYSATIEVTTNAAVGPQVQTLLVSGTGHVPVARIDIPPQYWDIDFRHVEIGFRFGRPLLVHNTGDLALTFLVEYVNNSGQADFDLELDPGSYSIPPGSERIFRQTLAPTSTGNKTVELRIYGTNDATFTQQNITLHGTGTTPIPVAAVLLLDRSGSMAETAGEVVKIEALRSAATLFVDLLRDGVDYLGLTKYNHQNQNYPTLGLIDTVRANAKALLAQTADLAGIKPTGTTGIGGAMQNGADHYASLPPVGPSDPDFTEIMVVLTDGKENETPWIDDVINGYGTYPGLFARHPQLRTYSVGLGLSSNINADRLEKITNRGAGGFYLVTGNLEGLNIFNLENFYFKIFADAAGYALVADPPYCVPLEDPFEVSVGIISEDREALIFFISELPETAYVFELIDPAGAIISSSGNVGGMSVQVKRAHNWMFFRVKFPVPDTGTTFAGLWKFRARLIDPGQWKLNDEVAYSTVRRSRDARYIANPGSTTRARLHQVTVERPPSILARIWGVLVRWLASILAAKPAEFDPTYTPQFGQAYRAEGKHRVSFVAAVSSNYQLTASVSPETPDAGQPMRLQAILTQGSWPTTNATVTALIDRPDHTTESLTLVPDANNPNGGVFEGQYTNTTLRGTYHVTFHATGVTAQGEPVTRVTSRGHFVGAPSETPRSGAEECLSCSMRRILLGLAFLLWILILLLQLAR